MGTRSGSPFGVDARAGLDVVVFDGGLGDRYVVEA